MTTLHPVSRLAIQEPMGNRLGEILIGLGKLSLDDVDKVVRTQTERDALFGEVARELRLVDDQDISMALARQFRYPYLLRGEGALSPLLMAAYDPFSEQAEVLRTVRNQLTQTWFSEKRKGLVVLGCGAGAGNSVFTANLALSFAQANERTLLIDANMRAPSQHELFRSGPHQGLSDMIAGRRMADMIFPVPGFDSLYLLPAGTVPPNPQELLLHPGFRGLNERLAKQFDVILLDVPSLATAHDALIVAAQTGGALMVLRRHATRVTEVKDATRQLRRAGISLAGCVMVDF
ncbi:polysaccharide biosynthesis tyrosine autokinase [Noviherbaspirillum pedocola]|nr:polysaccharide biosynthesis tyrosine autokinase [Noviherbaspirillum pedocola]